LAILLRHLRALQVDLLSRAVYGDDLSQRVALCDEPVRPGRRIPPKEAATVALRR